MVKIIRTSPTKIVNPKDKAQDAWLTSAIKSYERVKVKYHFDRLKKSMITTKTDSIEDLHTFERFKIIVHRMEERYPNYKLLRRGNAQKESKIY